jgi:hypothetical protein
MDSKAQAALEYLMTYGWALIAISVVLGSVLFLTSNSSVPFQCQMNPSSGAITYLDHSVSGGNIGIILRNDSGKSISDVNLSFSGDFVSVSPNTGNGPYSSAQEFKITSSGLGLTSGHSYTGNILITYKRNNVTHISTAVCTGTI